MKTSYFFGENNLKSFFRPGWKGMGDPGVEEGRPDLRETETGMWSCLSALFEEILCTVSDYNPVEYLLFKHKQFLILVDGHYESRMHK